MRATGAGGPRARSGAAVAGAALLAGVLLAGCAPQDGLAAAGTPVPTTSATTGPATSGAASSPTAPATGAATSAVAAAGLAPCPASDANVAARDDGLPDVTLPCLGEGPDVRLAGLRGVPAVVNVWASWCGPCRTELPALADVAAAAGSRVRFFGIDLSDSPDAALALARDTGVRYASVQDPEGRVRAVLRPPLAGPPRTYFVRADGSIAARVDGAIDDPARLRSLVAEHLGVTV